MLVSGALFRISLNSMPTKTPSSWVAASCSFWSFACWSAVRLSVATWRFTIRRCSAPAAASRAAPVDDEIGRLHAVDVGEKVVPEEDLVDRPAGAGHGAEDIRLLTRADDEQVERDFRAHALDHVQHTVEANHVTRRM